jgi:hypothetical protein
MRITDKDTKIVSANIYLNSAPSHSGTFSLNFYYLKNGKPDPLAVNKSIINTLYLKKGWLTIDISKDDIFLNRDFAFAFEFLPTGEEKLKKSAIMYGGKLAGADSFFRLSSQCEWQKSQGAAYTMYLKVKQYIN